MQFRCPKCKTLLQVNTPPANGLIGCPGCKSTVRIPSVPPTTRAQPAQPQTQKPQAQKPTAPRPTAQKPASSSRSGPAQDDLFGGLSDGPLGSPLPSSAPRAAAPATGGFSAPAYQQPQQPAYAAPRAQKKRGGPSVLKIFAIIAAVGGGLMILGCVGLFGLGLVARNVAANKMSTATISGYSVDAPGSLMGTKVQGDVTGQTIYNRVTGTEFMIAELKRPGVPLTPDLVIMGIKTQKQITHAPTTRNGMTGIRYETVGGNGAPIHIGEVYPLGSSVLLVIYMTAEEIEKTMGKKAPMTAAKARETDKPDAFFASLRRAGAPAP